MEGKDKLLPKSSNSTKDKTSSKEKVYDFTLSIMKKLNDHNKIEMSKEEFNRIKKIIIKYNKDVIIPELNFLTIHSTYKMNKPKCDKSIIITFLIVTIFNYYSYFKKEAEKKQLISERLHIISLTIIKLYDNSFFDCKDVFLFSKIFLYLSISDYKKNKLNDNQIKLFSLLKISIEIMKNILFNLDNIIHNFIVTSESQQCFIDYCHFFKQTLLNNEENLFLFRRYEKDYLNIIEFTNVLKYLKEENQIESMKNCLIELISTLYEFKFTYTSIMAPFLYQIQDALINIKEKSDTQLANDIILVNFSIDYINQIIQKEKSLLSKDPNQLTNGLYVSGESSPLVISKFLLTYYTLIFSFKLSPVNNSEDIYTLLSIQEPNKEPSVHLKLTLQKKNNKYIMYISQIKQIQKESYETTIEVLPYLTYVCVLSLSKNKKTGQLTIDCSCHNDIQQFTIEISKNMVNDNNEKVLLLGCEIENNNKPRTTFEGYFGSIIYFDSIPYDKDFIKHILLLKGRYENILTLIGYDNSYINSYIGTNDKYHKVVQSIVNWTSQNNKITFSDMIKKLKFYFSSKTLRFENYKDEIELSMNEAQKNKEERKSRKTISKNVVSRVSSVSNLSHSSSHSNASKTKVPEYSTKNINILGLKENSIGNTIQLEYCKYFNKNFHLFYNKETLFAFLENDGISFLCLQFEYYFQVLSQIQKNNSENRESILLKM